MKRKTGDKVIKSCFVLLILMSIYLIFEYVTKFKGGDEIFPHIFQNSKAMASFTRIFLSIIMEGFPFILIGAIISSLIHLFVSEKTIKNMLPQRSILGIMVAGLLGIIFPVCECAIVPIVRRLIKKGMPIHIAITFMIAVPILNPIVLFSTYVAFSSIEIAVLRGVLGYGAACVIGLIIMLLNEKNPMKRKKISVKPGNKNINMNHIKGCGCSMCNENGQHHSHNHSHGKKNSGFVYNLKSIIEHTNEELMTIGKYFIIGACVSSAFQVVISKKALEVLGGGSVTSVIVMIAIAFILSLCSEADAFIARAFAENFTSGSIIAFLIFGPMIDLKNTLMLGGYFKKSFIAKLILVIFAVVFVVGCFINMSGGLII